MQKNVQDDAIKANANHILANEPYYRRERIVRTMQTYAELAQVAREARMQGVDLVTLARDVSEKGAASPVRAAHVAAEPRAVPPKPWPAVNRDLRVMGRPVGSAFEVFRPQIAEYLNEIQAANDWANWRVPPGSAYSEP